MSPPETRAVVAGNVRAAAARAQVGREAIAARIGLHRTSVSRKLNGHQPFTAEELADVASLLGVDVAALYRHPSLSSGQDGTDVASGGAVTPGEETDEGVAGRLSRASHRRPLVTQHGMSAPHA